MRTLPLRGIGLGYVRRSCRLPASSPCSYLTKPAVTRPALRSRYAETEGVVMRRGRLIRPQSQAPCGRAGTSHNAPLCSTLVGASPHRGKTLDRPEVHIILERLRLLWFRLPNS